MSSLTAADKLYLEKVLDMGDGYVLNFNDATFGKFFNDYDVDIHGAQYQTYGKSKARKMRAFWEKEPDALVSAVLSGILDTYEALCDLGDWERDPVSLEKSHEIVSRLSGMSHETSSITDEGFLNKEFRIPNIEKLPVDFAVSEIVQERLKEAQAGLSVGVHLSVIVQCGSVLEAVLLGAAQKDPERFNRSRVSPKRDGKVKAFHEWSLSEFINVAYDIDLLGQDVQKFSHGLRDFRNYIHPYQQMASGFKPDEHTAKVCFQVLKAALADVSGER